MADGFEDSKRRSFPLQVPWHTAAPPSRFWFTWIILKFEQAFTSAYLPINYHSTLRKHGDNWWLLYAPNKFPLPGTIPSAVRINPWPTNASHHSGSDNRESSLSLSLSGTGFNEELFWILWLRTVALPPYCGRFAPRRRYATACFASACVPTSSYGTQATLRSAFASCAASLRLIDSC